MMRTLLVIARKDASVIFRDKAAVLVMLAMPLGLIFILGSALGGIESGGGIDARVAIVNLDEGETGELFVDGLTGADELAKIFDIDVRDDVEAVRDDVERGDLTAALIIPRDLTRRIAAGEPVSLQVLQDPGSKVAAGVWAGVARAAVANASAQIVYGRTLASYAPGGGGPPPSDTPQASVPVLDAVTVREVEASTEKRISMISYYSAGMTGMFLLFGSMFGAFAFLKERREQTFARMLVTPASKLAIVGGKTLGIFSIVVAQFLLLLVGTRLLFGVDWGSGLSGTVGLGLAEAFAAAGLAMTLTALGKTERAVGGIGPALIIFFAATGGSMLPAELLPVWLKPVQIVSPVYWAVGGFLDVMTGAGFADVVGRIGAILAIGAALFAFGVWRLRYE